MASLRPNRPCTTHAPWASRRASLGLALLAGLGVATTGCTDEPDEAVAPVAVVQPAPKAPQTNVPSVPPPAPADVEPEATPDPIPPAGGEGTRTRTRTRSPEDDPALKFALKMSKRLRDAGDTGAAVQILEDYIRSEGQVPAAVQARDAILDACRAQLDAGLAKARELTDKGQKEAAKQVLTALRSKLPELFELELENAIEALDKPPAAEKPPAVAQAEPEEDAPPNPHRSTFLLLLRNLSQSDNADAHYKLGVWARDRKLNREASQCFERAVALDGFHKDARVALGHVEHEGRWYSDEEYKEQVLGLVKNDKGEWVKPESIASGKTRERGQEPAQEPKVDGPVVPKPPPAPYDEEDRAWYSDDESVCSWEDAPYYESKYYRIRTNTKPEYAKKYGEMMDRYFKRFVKVFKELLPSVKYSKSEIWIYSSHQEFMDVERRGPGVGGYYQPSTKRVVCYHGNFGEGTTRDVLAHEGTHQFQDIVLRGNLMNAPIWIIEGLAVFFESAYYDGKSVRVGLIPRQRLWRLKQYYATNDLIPLRELIRTPQSRFSGKHYAHAWSLIYMVLYRSDDAKIRRRSIKWFSDLFSASLNQRVTATDVEDGLGGRAAFREFEKSWKEWVNALPYDFDPKKG